MFFICGKEILYDFNSIPDTYLNKKNLTKKFTYLKTESFLQGYFTIFTN